MDEQWIEYRVLTEDEQSLVEESFDWNLDEETRRAINALVNIIGRLTEVIAELDPKSIEEKD